MNYNSICDKNEFYREILRLEKQAKLGWEREIRTLKLLGLKDGMDILDAGSGPGYFSEIILNSFSNSRICALDSDMKLINLSSERLSNNYVNRIGFINSSIYNTKIKSNTFDIILARFLFQHLDDPMAALKEMYRILKPGGKIIITDVDNNLWGATNPDNQFIALLNAELQNVQKTMGGDRQIGRKLLTLLRKSNFRNLNIEAVVKHSEILGMNNFKNNLPEDNILNPKLKNIINEYNKFYNNEDSSIMNLLLFAAGEK